MAANFVVDLLPLQKGYRQVIRLIVIAIDMTAPSVRISAGDAQDAAAWREQTPKLRDAATARWIVRFPNEAGTVGWVLPSPSFFFDFPT